MLKESCYGGRTFVAKAFLNEDPLEEILCVELLHLSLPRKRLPMCVLSPSDVTWWCQVK